MKTIFRKSMNSLVPDGHEAEELIRSIKHGALVFVEIKRGRNIQHHRKFFAMLQIVLENQEYYASIDHLLGAFKLAVGHVDLVKTKHGTVGIPKSISFAKMDQTAFEVFYNSAVVFVCEHVIPGLSASNLDRQVAEQLGDIVDIAGQEVSRFV